MESTPAPSYDKERSTSDPDESSAGTGHGSTTTSSTTSTRLPKGLDLDGLSPRGEAIKILLADDLADGHNLNTLAKELGLSSSSASALMEELRSELELQAGPVPPLSADEYQALKESIQQDGVRVPVIIGEHSLIDGRHRWRATRELGLKEIPAIFLRGLTVDQERDACIAVNAIRRQLTREQRTALARVELTRNPRRSSRQIANLCGLHHSTVEAIRQRMREESETKPTEASVAMQREHVEQALREPDVRIDTLGRVNRVEPRPDPPEVVDRPIGYGNCGNCGRRHAIYRDGAGVRLEAV